VARDRKRAKQRRERRGTTSGRSGGSAQRAREAARSTPTEAEELTADVPGALDHASGEADEFRAALVRGADGVPVSEAPAEDRLQESEPDVAEPDVAEPDGAEPDVAQPAGAEPAGAEPAGAEPAVAAAAEDGVDGSQEQARREEHPSGAPLGGGNRAAAFLRASWAELQRVQWPDRRQVTQATAVVLGFVAVAGAYLGLADFVAKEIVEFIL
jgi:preprotein translocase subunit SecE